MMRAFPEAALERLLEALEHEVLEASDAEILAAAAELGMQPGMKGSAAFIGLRFSAALRAEDFFDDPQWMLRMRSRPRSAARRSPRPPKEPNES